MPGDKTFVDTNVIIYAYDNTAGKKHELARTILSDLWKSGLGVISTQVLQEFFVNVVKKIPKPLELGQAQGIVKDLLKWRVVTLDGASIMEAIEICLKYHYSFWDSLIIEAANDGGAARLYSEDLQDGQVIGGVRFINPCRL